MSKFLIGTLDGKVRSAHNAPLNFSISGRYVVDVPQDISVEADTDSLQELLHEKIVGLMNRPACSGLVMSQSDELLAVPNVDADPAKSTSCSIGPNKRCAMLPGGTLVTNPVPISSLISKIYFHWYGFILAMDPGLQPPASVPQRPDPPRILYNYDPVAQNFTEFNPASLSVQVWDAAYTAPILAAQHEVVQSWSFGPANVRLKFTNQSSSFLFLSDWAFLHDSAV